jgi:DNA-binding response OmpR family regulator
MAVQSGNSAGSILIVDEDHDARSFTSTTLHDAGYATREVASGEDALKAAHRRPPILVLLEVRLSGISGYEVCRELRVRLGDSLPIIFLSGTRTDPLDRVAGLLIGADDYLVKPFAPDELIARVRGLIRRATPQASAVASKLTQREQEVLRLLAEGLSQQDIASRLRISPKTVSTHMEHIFAKLGVHSGVQAVALAYRDNLIDTGPSSSEGLLALTLLASDLWEPFSACVAALPS